jgi:hypothetical protein
MSGLKLNDSIFDTSTDKYGDWNFGGIVKDVTPKDLGIDDASIHLKGTIPEEIRGSFFDSLTGLGGGSPIKTTNGGSFVDNMTKWWGGETPPPPKIETDTGMFSGKNIGSTLQGGGAIVGALSGIYGTLKQEKFNKEVLGMEKDRINRNIAREDKLQKNYQGVWS